MEYENSLENESRRKSLNSVLQKKSPDEASEIYEPTQVNDGSTILVAVRNRPLTKKEHGISQIRIIENNTVVLLDPTADQYIPEEAFRINRTKEKQYAYDHAFQEETTQQEIFDFTTKPLLEIVANGFNATVFAYGATGAGKTYTMLGTVENPGIMILTLDELFKLINEWSDEREFQIKLSYLEIYNEMIRDLINVSTDMLDIREDPVKGITVAGLSEILVTSPQDVLNTIRMSNKNRTVEPTNANETSSRSHAVLQITVEQKNAADPTNIEILQGKLSLIDLAGSERASNTHNRGMRLIEGANINRSLLALANCINALFDIQRGVGKVHIPYRNSKLTRLLKESLGGNSRTVMIACVCPHISAYEDTHNTLKYANRAKNIKTTARANVINSERPITKYQGVINLLKNEITNLRGKMQQSNSQNTSPDGKVSNSAINKLRLEMSNNFRNEAMQRKTLHEIDQRIQNLGFVIYNRQTEYEAKVTEEGEKSKAAVKLLDELDILKNTMTAQENALQKQLEAVEDAERDRAALKVIWKRNKVPEPHLTQLKLEFKKHVLTMEKIDLTRQENNAGFKIRQKETYINRLEEQMKLRDRMIRAQAKACRENNIEINSDEISKEMRPLEKITEEVRLILPDIYSGKARQVSTPPEFQKFLLGNENVASVQSQSVIRAPNNKLSAMAVKISPRTLGQSQSQNVITLRKQNLSPYRRKAMPGPGPPPPQRRIEKHNNTSIDTEVSESTASTNSKYQYNNLRNVAAKYQSSVYNKPKTDSNRTSIGQRKQQKVVEVTIKDPITKPRTRINPGNVRYGMHLRSDRRY